MHININWTLFIALWGAILSTVVFLWDIYKWRTAGPKLRFVMQAYMEPVNWPEHDGKRFITFTVTNYGDRPTTITDLGYFYYRNRRWISRKTPPDKCALVVGPSPAQPLPFELKPGTRWIGMTFQTPDIEQLSREGKLFFLLHHSHSEKPVKRRLIIHPLPSKTDTKAANREK